MAATKLQRNWTGVAFATLPVTKVTKVSISQGGKLLPFTGDADTYPDTIVSQGNEPSVSLDSGDIATLEGLGGPGSVGTFTATHNDAKLATGGAIVWTVINCVLENTDADGSAGEYGSGTTTFKAFSSDGTTNPVSFSRA
jgi:hypothetical protein